MGVFGQCLKVTVHGEGLKMRVHDEYIKGKVLGEYSKVRMRKYNKVKLLRACNNKHK